MATYKAPLEDMKFVLYDVFGADQLWTQMSATAEVNRELADAVLDEAGKMVEGLLLPLNRSGDEQGCQWDGGQVTTPPGFRDAYQTFAANGWCALSGNPAYGGQGMPKMLSVLFDEMLHGSNSGFALYPALSSGASLCLDAHASEDLKAVYLPKLYSGEWSGTMCLTEPHSGSDLGIMRTRAEPAEEGSFRISGTKIFITGGEHDLSDNIVHLVLARLPDAPAGTGGISLFLVPKFLPDAHAVPGERNSVHCGSIEHKMGIQASATAVLNFENAIGWMIGKPNKGLAAMFTMMNYERLSIGLQGVGLGEASYQSAVDYARERLQGRAPGGTRYPDSNADPIIVHADVRRMLLTMRAFNQGGRALAVYLGMQMDIARYSDDATACEKADQRVALLTPVAKAFFTDRGFEACVLGQQIFGGHGYVREWGMEQFVRDARIAQIYEGTNGIQAMDLAGRKVVRNQGAWVKDLVTEVRAWMSENQQVAEMAAIRPLLEDALQTLEEATAELLSQAQNDADAVGALAVEYLDIFGLTTYAWLWARMLVATGGQKKAADEGRRATGRFFMERILPRAKSLLTQMRAGSDAIMQLTDDQF